MTLISPQEVIKIAAISHIQLQDDEIEYLMHQIEQILTYAERVAQFSYGSYDTSYKNVNVVREDVTASFDVQAVLKQAPETEGNYFVVPIILENS